VGCATLIQLRDNSIPPAPNLLCTDVDYKGIVYGTRLAIHFMSEIPIPGTKIVAITSAADVLLFVTYLEYDGAKAALINFIWAVAVWTLREL
jgi:hypothetical protein